MTQPIDIIPPPNELEKIPSPTELGQIPAPSMLKDIPPPQDLKLDILPPPEKLKKDADYGEAIWLGFKQGIAPHTITKEEWKKDRTLGETITEAATQLATGIGTAAATGAALGSVVPGIGSAAGLVGGIAYGIYSGIGYEVSRSRAEDHEFSPLRAAANVTLEANPLIKGGSKAIKAMRLAYQVGGSVAVEKSYGTDDPTALGLFAVGGALSMAGPMLAKSNPTQAQTKGYADVLASGEYDIVGKTQKKIDAMDLTKIEIDEGLKKFVAELSDNAKPKQIDRAFDMKWEKMSDDIKQDVFESYQWQKVQLETTSEVADELYVKAGKRPKDPLIPIFNKLIQDPKFAARDVDRRFGTTLEEVVNQFSEAEIKTSNSMAPYLKRATKLLEQGKKVKISEDQIGKRLNGYKIEISPEAEDLVVEWRKLYDDAHQHFKSNGYDVGYLHNYMNMQLLDAPELSNAIKKEADFFRELAAKNGATFETLDEMLSTHSKRLRLSKAEVQNLEVRWLELKNTSRGLTGSEISSFPTLDAAVDAALDPSTKQRLGYEMSILFQREGSGIPDQFRNFNIGSNFMGYLNGNFKAVHYARPMRDLTTNIQTMKALGLKQSAEYWSKYARHMSGQESGAKQWLGYSVNKKRAEWRRIIENDPTSFKSKIAKTNEFLVDFASWSQTLAYPNLLGLNVRASLRNLHQTLLLTAPHLDGAYGYRIVRKGWGQMMKHTGSIEDFLKDKQIVSGVEVIKDAQMALGESIRRHGTLGQLTKYSDKVSEKLMWIYSKTDHINRMITYHAGKAWAKDLIAKDPRALKNLKRLSPAAQTEIRAQNMLKNEELLGDYLGRQLVSDTQFHYGKTQMHQLGREGGKLFSMFTKWPSMTASETIYHLRNKEFRQPLMKFGTPLALLHAAQAWRNAEGEERAWFTYTYGKDLKDMAPILSATNVDLFGGPIQRTALSSAKMVIKLGSGEAEFSDAFKGAYEGVKVFSPIPGQSVINEMERFHKAHGGQPFKDIMADELGLE